MKTIYLDNNATTAVAPEVLDVMLPYLTDQYGNPSSIHRFGGLVRRHINKAREQVAHLIGAKPDQIIFTGCGSESDNMAIAGFLKKNGTKTRIITSTVEHPAVRNLCLSFRDTGVSVVETGVDAHGLLKDTWQQKDLIDGNTLVSFMWANNETGVLFPVEQVAQYVKAHDGYMHTDAVQAVGKIPIDCSKIPVDFLSLSGHKLHAPKGIGALFVRNHRDIAPLIIGGHQEYGLRAGTENVAFIVGLGKAAELAASRTLLEQTRVRTLRDRLENALLSSCPDARLNGDKMFRLPNTTNISFGFIEGEAVLLLLDELGIAASSGSACTSGSLEPSHVMKAMGVPYTYAHSSTRFSLSCYSTDQEVDAVINAMPSIVNRLRKLSPFVRN